MLKMVKLLEVTNNGHRFESLALTSARLRVAHVESKTWKLCLTMKENDNFSKNYVMHIEWSNLMLRRCFFRTDIVIEPT